LGLILTYFFAFQLPLLPIFGGYSPGASPAFNWRFIWDVFQHALLPALSIILVATGGWALGMRGMMVTTMGEDYVIFAEAKGLKASTVFLRYCVRNAVLPQVTALALALGQILSGAVLVEVIFGYPGIGTVLSFVAAYYRGFLDTFIRGVADIGLTVPGLLVLIIIAVSIKGTLTVNQMAIVVASLAWLYPTRTIRAQVLSLRERPYV